MLQWGVLYIVWRKGLAASLHAGLCAIRAHDDGTWHMKTTTCCSLAAVCGEGPPAWAVDMLPKPWRHSQGSLPIPCAQCSCIRCAGTSFGLPLPATPCTWRAFPPLSRTHGRALACAHACTHVHTQLKKLGNAKAISSRDFQRDDGEGEAERSQRLSKFQSSTAISSSDYFGRGDGGGSGGPPARSGPSGSNGSGGGDMDVTAADIVNRLSLQVRCRRHPWQRPPTGGVLRGRRAQELHLPSCRSHICFAHMLRLSSE